MQNNTHSEPPLNIQSTAQEITHTTLPVIPKAQTTAALAAHNLAVEGKINLPPLIAYDEVTTTLKAGRVHENPEIQSVIEAFETAVARIQPALLKESTLQERREKPDELLAAEERQTNTQQLGLIKSKDPVSSMKEIAITFDREFARALEERFPDS